MGRGAWIAGACAGGCAASPAGHGARRRWRRSGSTMRPTRCRSRPRNAGGTSGTSSTSTPCNGRGVPGIRTGSARPVSGRRDSPLRVGGTERMVALSRGVVLGGECDRLRQGFTRSVVRLPSLAGGRTHHTGKCGGLFFVPQLRDSDTVLRLARIDPSPGTTGRDAGSRQRRATSHDDDPRLRGSQQHGGTYNAQGTLLGRIRTAWLCGPTTPMYGRVAWPVFPRHPL